MGQPVGNINPEILAWARLSAGLSPRDVAEKLHKPERVVLDWEAGTAAPTYAQLERLAYQIYKRPIAVFFFSVRPDEEGPEHSFRTLPGFEIEDLNPRTRFLRREALAMKEFVADLKDGVNEQWIRFSEQCRFESGSSATALATKVRRLLGVDYETQSSWSSSEVALEAWRNAVEQVGVFVFKDFFDQEDISGFCIHDDLFPIIYINNSHPKTRQIFSLVHELGHLIAGTGGITKSDDSFIDVLPSDHREIEMFCNRFAADVLIPTQLFNPTRSDFEVSDRGISRVAKAFSVSREVVLRRLLDNDVISSEHYERKVAQWVEEYREIKSKRKGGGNYYATQVAYLGLNYLKLAFAAYYRGAISEDRLARYLKVKTSNLHKLEDQYVAKVG